MQAENTGATPTPGGALPETASPALYALQYGRIGWATIPIKPGSKTPLLTAWDTEASADAATIRPRWKSQPRAGIGIHCGMSGSVCVDVDVRNRGLETLAAIEAKHGPLWGTGALIARTGGGGWHYVFKAPAGVELPHSLGPGVDLLHGNHFFIVAPTVHPSGTAYRWEDGSGPFDAEALAGMPELPEWARTGRLSEAQQTTSVSTPPDPADRMAEDVPPDESSIEVARVKSALDTFSDEEISTLPYERVEGSEGVAGIGGWMQVLFALKWTKWQCAEALAREWSERSTKHKARDFKAKWRGAEKRARARPVTLGTLFNMAKAIGWDASRKDVSAARAARTAADSGGGVSLICAADVIPEAIPWVWPGWLPGARTSKYLFARAGALSPHQAAQPHARPATHRRPVAWPASRSGHDRRRAACPPNRLAHPLTQEHTQ